jgi:hypothetical protein
MENSSFRLSQAARPKLSSSEVEPGSLELGLRPTEPCVGVEVSHHELQYVSLRGDAVKLVFWHPGQSVSWVRPYSPGL